MAANRDISIYRGDTYIHEIRINNSSNTPIDINNRSYDAQIRKTVSSDVLISFTSTITDAANGVLQISLTANQTSNIKPGIYIYDLQEINNENVLTLLRGNVNVTGDITR